MNVLRAAVLLCLSACISFHTKDYTFADVSPLLAPDLDVASAFCKRLPDSWILITADPDCDSRGAPQRGVVEFAMSRDWPGAVLAVFVEEQEAISRYRHLCRTQSFRFDDDEVRWLTVPDGEACVIPYYQRQNSAHGAWAWTGQYHGSAVVRRGRLVVNIKDQLGTEELGASGIDPLAARLAEWLTPVPPKKE